MAMDLRLRFDYGHILPGATHHASGLKATAGPDAVYLRSPVAVHGQDNSSVAEFRVTAEQRLPFVLTWAPSHHAEPPPIDADTALRDTLEFRQRWAARRQVEGPYRVAREPGTFVSCADPANST